MRMAILMALTMLASTAFSGTVSGRIMAAAEAGELTQDETALYLTWSIVSPEKLPEAFTTGTEIERCATPAALEAERLLEHVSPAVAEEVRRGLARPGFSGPPISFISPGDHFRIHYTTQGIDAVTEAFANEVALAADLSWQVQCDDMKYHIPPSDQGMGGCHRYDIYIKNIPYMGYCTHSGEYKPPDSTQNASASHIVISNTLNSDHIKVTVAHEFQHAVQFAYDFAEGVWFMENCAVFMEEMVYPDINDYMSYLGGGDNPIRKPWWDIRSGSSNLYWYGGVTWAFFIWQRNEVEAVRLAWEECAAVPGNNALGAIDEMFKHYGMDFEQGFMEYGFWRWFVASNWYDGGMYFAEAAQWPGNPFFFSFHNVTTIPFSGDQGVYPPESFGIHWIRVNLANYQDGWVNFSFDGRDNMIWKVGAILWNTSGASQCAWYDAEYPSGTASVSVPTTGWDYVIFYPAVLTQSGLAKNYTFDITHSLGIAEGNPLPEPMLSVAANPMAPGGTVTFSMPEAGVVRLALFDLSGRKVSTLAQGSMPGGSHTVGISDDLATGTYFLTLSHSNGVETIKVVVAR